MNTILIVEDDRHLGSALVGEVQRLGHHPLLATSAQAAIELLLTEHVDVMLTDLRMSGRDGIELIEEARAASPLTRAVLMSAYATAKDYKLAVELGAVDVLTKPFSPEDMERAITKALECHDGFRGEVHGFALTDLLQMFNQAQRSLVVHVDDADGAVYMEKGVVVHATCGAVEGVEALRMLLRRHSGSIRTSPLGEVPHTVDAKLDVLLLELAVHDDEVRHSGAPAATDEVRFSFPPGMLDLASDLDGEGEERFSIPPPAPVADPATAPAPLPTHAGPPPSRPTQPAPYAAPPRTGRPWGVALALIACVAVVVALIQLRGGPSERDVASIPNVDTEAAAEAAPTRVAPIAPVGSAAPRPVGSAAPTPVASVAPEASPRTPAPADARAASVPAERRAAPARAPARPARTAEPVRVVEAPPPIPSTPPAAPPAPATPKIGLVDDHGAPSVGVIEDSAKPRVGTLEDPGG